MRLRGLIARIEEAACGWISYGVAEPQTVAEELASMRAAPDALLSEINELSEALRLIEHVARSLRQAELHDEPLSRLSEEGYHHPRQKQYRRGG